MLPFASCLICCESPLNIFLTKPATSQKITNQELWSLALILLLTIVLPMRNVHLTSKLKIPPYVDAMISYDHTSFYTVDVARDKRQPEGWGLWLLIFYLAKRKKEREKKEKVLG